MRLHRTALITCIFAVLGTAPALAQSLNGRAGTMPAYYDDELFTVNFKELEQSGANVALHNKNLNTIYITSDLQPDGSMFAAVLDAIQGDGFNPLWLELEIEFINDNPPRQLESDTEVEAAAAAHEIRLRGTGEIYRCSVIGPKKQSGPGGGVSPGAGEARALGTAAGIASAGRAGSPSASRPGARSWGSILALYRN
jgi:hypothetical protein